MRRLLGLISVIVGGVMFATLVIPAFGSFVTAWESSTDLMEQAEAVINVVWNTVYQPLVLLTIGAVALTGK